jgi:hypothetical protein
MPQIPQIIPIVPAIAPDCPRIPRYAPQYFVESFPPEAEQVFVEAKRKTRSSNLNSDHFE